MLIGAVKAGSSSVYGYLGQHPDIYVSPQKETKFFQWDGEAHRFSTKLDQEIYNNSIKTFDDYMGQFKGANGELAIGEATPSYLYNNKVAARAYRRFPDAKILVVLRHPVDRAFSHFLHTKRLGYEPLTFLGALAEEQYRITANWGPSWHYASQGYYYEQLKRFMEFFGKERMNIYLFDDLKSDPVGFTQNMYRFVGVDPCFEPDTKKIHNSGEMPKNKFMHDLANKPNLPKTIIKSMLPKNVRGTLNNFIRNKNSHKPKLDSDIRRELSANYQQDIRKTEDLIGIDMSRWYL